MNDNSFDDADVEDNGTFFDHEYIQQYPHEYNDIQIFEELVGLVKCEINVTEQTLYDTLDSEDFDEAMSNQKAHEESINSDSILLTNNEFKEDNRHSFYRFTYKNQSYHLNGHDTYDVLDYVVDIVNLFLENIKHSKRVSIIGDMYEDGGVEVVAINLD